MELPFWNEAYFRHQAKRQNKESKTTNCSNDRKTFAEGNNRPPFVNLDVCIFRNYARLPSWTRVARNWSSVFVTERCDNFPCPRNLKTNLCRRKHTLEHQQLLAPSWNNVHNSILLHNTKPTHLQCKYLEPQWQVDSPKQELKVFFPLKLLKGEFRWKRKRNDSWSFPSIIFRHMNNKRVLVTKRKKHPMLFHIIELSFFIDTKRTRDKTRKKQK